MEMQGTIQAAGKTAAGMVIPDEVVGALGPSRHPAVRVTVNGYTFRSSIARMGGAFMLPFNPETRAGAHVAAGDTVTLEIELDTAPREVELPAELGAAFERDPLAAERFSALSYSKKRRLVIPIETAKTEATRQRLAEKTVASLRDRE